MSPFYLHANDFDRLSVAQSYGTSPSQSPASVLTFHKVSKPKVMFLRAVNLA